MYIPSPYRVTLEPDAVVLLDFGDEVVRPLDVFGSGVAQEVDFAGAEGGKVFGRGNARGSISWERIKQFNSHEQAQGWKFALMATVPRGVTRSLLVEIENGASFRLESFVLTDVTPQEVVRLGFPLQESYSGTWAGVTVVTNTGLGGVSMSNISETHSAISDSHLLFEPS